MTNKTLYMAYGSNMNIGQMANRCPDARPIHGFILPDFKLVFRGVADIEPSKGSYLPIGLWEITDKCLIALDHYEGVSKKGNGLYRRHYFRDNIFHDRTVMTYMMNHKGISEPSRFYYNVIKEGYADFGLDDKHLRKALAEAREKTVTDYDFLGYRDRDWWYDVKTK